RQLRSSTGTQIYDSFSKSAISQMEAFRRGTNEEVRAVIMGSPTKSCPLDPIPTFILKEAIDVLLPFVAAMCNASLQEGIYRHPIATLSSHPSSSSPTLTRTT